MSYLLVLSRQRLKRGDLQFLLGENLLHISNVIHCLLQLLHPLEEELCQFELYLVQLHQIHG